MDGSPGLVRVCACLSLPACRGFALANGAHFFRNVDPNGTPGDTAATAYTPGRAELVDPACQLVRHPLAVTRLGGGPHAATGDVREIHGEARIPPAPALGAFTRQVGRIFDGGAEAGGADHRAVSAG